MTRGFDCHRDCVRGGEFDDGERASRGCTHPTLPRVKWDPPDVLAERLGWYLGRAAAYQHRHKERKPWQRPDWWLEPPEPVEDGCPAGWSQSPFARSVVPYLRRRTEGGGRVQNPRFDDLTDRVAQDAALYFEEEQERLVSYQMRRITEERERKRGSGNT